MRDKLITHGQRIFDTYELLEMLLYHAAVRVDTNPIAKRLLARFGSLDGVLLASKEELMEVSGIGERTAELIITAGEMLTEGELSRYNQTASPFDDYTTAGEFTVKYMNERAGLTVVAFLLDGCMQLLDTVEIYGVDFGSAAIRSKTFIDRTIISGATLAIFAHKRDHSAIFPHPCDRETIKMLANDLGAIGVRVVEHYSVSQTCYYPMSRGVFTKLESDSEKLLGFILSRREAGVSDE